MLSQYELKPKCEFLKGKVGMSNTEQNIAPKKDAIGTQRYGGIPNFVFKIALKYPPTPTKNAMPRQTSPTKLVKKSKTSPRRINTHDIIKTFCQ